MINKNSRDIGEVIKQSGLPGSTLRFYEEKGLIKPIGRTGLRRNFNANVLQRLALITLGRRVGFSLREIATIFTADGPRIDRKQLTDKVDQLDKTIKHLTSMRDGLRHAAKCSAPSHFECSEFLRLLDIAVKGQQRKKHNQSVSAGNYK